MTRTTNNYRPFSNPFNKSKQEELLINETELHHKADTTESRLDQQSDIQTHKFHNITKNTKSKDRKLRFFTLFKLHMLILMMELSLLVKMCLHKRKC
jgi:hypothetical protein